MAGSGRLHIAVVGVNYSPERSGIAPYTTRLVEGLAERGHHVEVLTSRPHYPQWRVPAAHRKGSREVHGSVVLRRLRHYIPRSPSALRRVLFELSFGARASLSRWGDPDVVICVSPALLSSGMVALRARTGVSRPALGVVVQDLYSRGVQEAEGRSGAVASLATRLESLVLGLFDGVVVIHDRFKRQATEGLELPGSRISVIRNWSHVAAAGAFDVDRFRESMGWGSESVVLHAGAMGVKQDLGNVVDAARLASQTQTPIRFVLLGDGSQRAAVARAADGLDNIDFLDQVDDDTFVRALAAADVLLVNEGVGVRDMAVPSKLTSYFKAGRPVLAATDAESASAEELAAARAGLRVPARDPQALVAAVVGLRDDPAAAAEMGRRGQDYCASQLTEDVALQKYDDWVDALAQHARRTRKRTRPRG